MDVPCSRDTKKTIKFVIEARCKRLNKDDAVSDKLNIYNKRPPVRAQKLYAGECQIMGPTHLPADSIKESRLI